MAKRSHQQEDPWAGFVDVLSNVVMVVTFIVIILGIAMFAMSQQVAKNIAKQMVEEALAKQAAEGGGGVGSAGAFRTVTQRPTLVDDEIQGETHLTIRRRLEETTEHTVAALEEQAPSPGSLTIAKAQALLKLQFEAEKHTLDDPSIAVAKAALANAGVGPDTKVDVRALAVSRIGSISEARRIAFYRAMAVRNLLIEHGLTAANITLELRESVSPEDADSVLLFLPD